MSRSTDPISEASIGIAMHGVLCGLTWQLTVDILQDCRSIGNIDYTTKEYIGYCLNTAGLLFLLGMFVWVFSAVFIFWSKDRNIVKEIWIARIWSFLLLYIGMFALVSALGFYLRSLISTNTLNQSILLTAIVFFSTWIAIRWFAGKKFKS